MKQATSQATLDRAWGELTDWNLLGTGGVGDEVPSAEEPDEAEFRHETIRTLAVAYSGGIDKLLRNLQEDIPEYTSANYWRDHPENYVLFNPSSVSCECSALNSSDSKMVVRFNRVPGVFVNRLQNAGFESRAVSISIRRRRRSLLDILLRNSRQFLTLYPPNTSKYSMVSSKRRFVSGDPQSHQPHELRIDVFVAFLSLGLFAGLLFDGQVHMARAATDFVTVEHVISYVIFTIICTILGVVVWRNRTEGQTSSRTIPDTYSLTVWGIGLFAASVVGDFILHRTIGDTIGIAGVTVVPHLLMAIGSGLIVSGPFRSVWHQTHRKTGFRIRIVALVSAMVVVAAVAFIATFIHPLVDSVFTVATLVQPLLETHHRRVPLHFTPDVGTLSIGVQIVILTGIGLFLGRRPSLMRGTFTLLLGCSSFVVSILTNQPYFIPAALLAGLTADWLYERTDPPIKRPAAFRVYAFTVAATMYGLYVLGMSVDHEVVWTAPMWFGGSVIVGLASVGVSYSVSISKSEALTQPQTTTSNQTTNSESPTSTSITSSNCVRELPEEGTKSQSSLNREEGDDFETFETESVVDTYVERATDGLFNKERKAIWRHFTKQGATVLDLGCGTGRVTYPLHEGGFDVTGVDPSQPMIESANAIFPEIDFQTGDAADLDFEDESFDYVMFSYYGIDYVHPEYRRLRAFDEIHRVLKPGGTFVFSSHNQWYALAALLTDYGALRNCFLRKENLARPFDRYRPVEGGAGTPRTYFTNPVRVRKRLEASGFELVEIVGEYDDASRYFEVAPHYVARKPNEAEHA